MPAIQPKQTVGALVAEVPARSRVFQRHGVDFCCGGGIQLDEICDAYKIDFAQLQRELEACEISDEGPDPKSMSVSELIEHIVETHHRPLEEELPRLLAMAERVARVHGHSDGRLLNVLQHLRALVKDMVPHMEKEERVLFPSILSLAETGALPTNRPFPQLEMPLQHMEHEHDNVGALLASLYGLTDGYTPPDWACNTYRALLDGLQELERDTHMHVHKENNILFPKARAMAEKA